jgi:hypothetical protein
LPLDPGSPSAKRFNPTRGRKLPFAQREDSGKRPDHKRGNAQNPPETTFLEILLHKGHENNR